MRTTVTLDPDVEALLREKMAQGDLSFKQALNDAIRSGLAPTPTEPYRIVPRAMGVPAVPLTHALRVAADLEDEEIVRKLALGK